MSQHPTRRTERTLRRLGWLGAMLLAAVLLFGVLAWVGVLRDAGAFHETDRPAPEVGRLRQEFLRLGPGLATAEVVLLPQPADAWVARWHVLREARESLDVSYFILDEDIFGLAFLGALLESADRGVAVRVILDALGTSMSRTLDGNDILDELRAHPGVEVRTFRTLFERFITLAREKRLTALIASEHDKILVGDDRLALTGGRNIASEYFASPSHQGHRFDDFDVLFRSPAAARQMTRAFERVYHSSGAEAGMPERTNLVSQDGLLRAAYLAMDAWLTGASPPTAHGPRVTALWNELRDHPELRGALGRWEPQGRLGQVALVDSAARLQPRAAEITLALERLVLAAEREIIIANPYLALEENTVQTLERVAANGVDIIILTNSPLSSDNPMTQAVFMAQWPLLLARVPTLELYVVGSSDTLHAKTAVIDDAVSLVGTYNLDPTAMFVSSELMSIIWSTSVTQDMRRWLLERIRQGAPAVYRYQIERDARGRPVLDDRGQPMVAFGPEDHLQPGQGQAAYRYDTVFAVARRVLGLSPFFEGNPTK